jgi:UDP-glucose 4-epimerase
VTRRVLVTGGAGFVGSHVVRAHLQAGDEVSVLDDLSTGRRDNLPADVALAELDVRSPAAQDYVARGRFDVLSHHAAQMDVRRSVADPVFDASVNVMGLLNVLEGAQRGGVRRIVFASSGGTVYGASTDLPLPETAPKLPLSPYGTAKLASEYYLAALGELRGFDAVALRYSNVYGPGQDPHGEAGVVAIFSRRVLAGETLTIFGDGTQTRDLVFVGDVAAAHLAAAERPLPPVQTLDSRAYNIATGVETSVTRVAALLAELAGTPSRVAHAAGRPGELQRNALGVEKAARELGWHPQTTLADGLAKTLRSMAED